MVYTVTCNGTIPCTVEGYDRIYYYIPYEYGSLIGPEKWWATIDKEPIYLWLDANWYLSIWVSLIYCTTVHLLQKIMENSQAFDLRRLLVLWNATLAMFSIFAFIRLIEEFRFVLSTRPPIESISYGYNIHQPGTLWAFCLGISKLFELFDTVFVVLNKKPLIFLHWFPHAVAVVYCARTGIEGVAAARWFMIMNLGAQSFMYTYYALTAAGYRPSRSFAKAVTTLQTGQMLVGAVISIIALYYKLQGQIIQQSYENIGLTFSIYAPLTLLFMQFYDKTYGFGRKNTKTQ